MKYTLQAQQETDENISNLLIYKPRADKIAQEVAQMLQELD